MTQPIPTQTPTQPVANELDETNLDMVVGGALAVESGLRNRESAKKASASDDA